MIEWKRIIIKIIIIVIILSIFNNTGRIRFYLLCAPSPYAHQHWVGTVVHREGGGARATVKGAARIWRANFVLRARLLSHVFWRAISNGRKEKDVEKYYFSIFIFALPNSFLWGTGAQRCSIKSNQIWVPSGHKTMTFLDVVEFISL